MQRFVSIIFSAALTALVFGAPAKAHQTIEVTEAFGIETGPGMANGAAYIDLTNGGDTSAVLTGISFGPNPWIWPKPCNCIPI